MTFASRVEQDSVRSQRLKERLAEMNDNEGESEYRETFETSKFFGIEHVRNMPACIDLRLKNYSFKAVPYSFIVEINFEPSDGIEIITTTKKINVTGRNLKLLYNYLTAYRVKFIEANMGNDLTEEKALFVEDIKIEEV